MKKNIKTRIINNKRSLRALMLLLSVALIIAIPITIFIMNIETPYFIIIDSDEDFLQWCDKGNGTVENPYIIAGHTITVPENYETTFGDHTTPCTPYALISISGVTKSFIIENNTLTMKNLCGGDNMIFIHNVNVPFIIRNNEFTSSGVGKDAITIISVNGSSSKISNNRFTSSKIYIRESNNISFIANEFHNTGAYSNHVRESVNISFQYNLFIKGDLEFYECSGVVLHNNTFDLRNSNWIRVIFGYRTDFTRYTNNTLVHAGLGTVSSDRIPLAFEGNTINGKPLGFFYNQTDFSIDNTTEYGQIILIQCSNATVTDQIINNTPSAIQITECINTTVANCNFTGNPYSVYVWKSNRTYIEDNDFHHVGLGTWGTGVRGSYANGLYMRRNLFVKLTAPFSQYQCTDVVDENNTII